MRKLIFYYSISCNSNFHKISWHYFNFRRFDFASSHCQTLLKNFFTNDNFIFTFWFSWHNNWLVFVFSFGFAEWRKYHYFAICFVWWQCCCV